MEQELQRWLRHAYRQGLLSRNAVIRGLYGVEGIVTGREVSLKPPRRILAALAAMF